MPEIIDALKTDDEARRRGALAAIEAIGPQAESAVPVLIDLFKESDGKNIYIAKALVAIGPAAKPAVPVFEHYLLRDREYWNVVIAYALFEITGKADYLKAIITLLNESDSRYVPRYAAQYLELMGANAQYIASDVEKWTRTPKGQKALTNTSVRANIEDFLNECRLQE
jgi:hypothetical protein